ncbi:MAG: ATP-binding protein [Akkermansiaceae bacterium]|nr:ATP-binding protein [Akkermansiaceae bacterium]
MIGRASAYGALETAIRRSRVVALLGPRQCGKTTMARQFVAPDSINYFDLEDPASLSRLAEPQLALERLEGLVVIDEIQRQPELFPLLRVLADRQPNPARFLVLGSATPELLRQSSESLAGRMETIELSGFTLSEVGVGHHEALWLRGGFPLSFLAESDADSAAWRNGFISTFLERDLPASGVAVSPLAMRRFWTMLAHYHGQTWNAAEIAAAMGVSATTTRRYVDLLSHTFMIRQLQPWHENLGKRQVKAPKIYFRDSGLFHSLAHIKTQKELLTHPKVGASWEGYAVEEAIRHFRPEQEYFWATHNRAELDLLIFMDGRKIGIECKRQDAPKLTPSMRIAMEDLKLDELHVIYPGRKAYPLADAIRVLPLESLA